VSFTPGEGVPGPFANCVPTAFTVTSQFNVLGVSVSGSAFAGADIPKDEYWGPVTVNGSGGSSCAAASGEIGSLTVSAFGVNPLSPNATQTFECDGANGTTTLAGGYDRAGSAVLVQLSGFCSIDSLPVGHVEFDAQIQFTPDGSSTGPTPSIPPTFQQLLALATGGQVSSAAFAGTYEVKPIP
jgi:hypothetical protein